MLTEKKQIHRLIFLFMMTYMISYITRINYGAIISEMESDTHLSRSLLSMALTGSFITYGMGQVVSGILGDKLSPKKLVLFGLGASVLMNILIPVCQSPYQMLAVWCVNGFAQSFLWPPIVKLMTAHLSEEDYKTASVKVSWGSSFGTIVVYLCAPLIISLFGWRGVFFFSAFCGVIMLFFWHRFAKDIAIEPKKKEATTGSLKVFFSPMMIFIMLAIILQGMLRDGVTTWMPSYISETYQMSNIVAILTGVVLPLFSILCFQISNRLYRKTFKNPLICAGVIFGVGAVSSLLLYTLSGANAACSVLFSALLTGCMHGVNLMLICMIPPYFKSRGNVSTVSGVLNSCTYIGSAVSTYGIAVISEKYDWSTTIFLWFIIALLGTACCFISAKPWAKQMK